MTKEKRQIFENLEKDLLSQEKLYFINISQEDFIKMLDKKSEKNVLNILKIFFSINNNKYTMYLNDTPQCNPSRRRSIGDIFLIVTYYFPEITLKELFQGLFNLMKEKYITSDYCTQIKKRVYYRSNFNFIEYIDENNLLLSDWMEYCEMDIMLLFPKSKPPKGKRVKILKNIDGSDVIGLFGTLIIENYSSYYNECNLIEFDSFIYGHDGDGLGNNGYCWWFSKDCYEIIEEKND